MEKKMKKSAFMFMGGMLAFFSLSAPIMAQEENHSSKHENMISKTGNNVSKNDSKNDNNDQNKNDDVNITDVSNSVVAGKGKISFTVPEGKKAMDLEFTCYKKNGKDKVVQAKVKGNYTAGKHTIDIDLPADVNKNDLEITCQGVGSAKVVTWNRAVGGVWKAFLNGSVKLPDVAVTNKSVISGVTNTVLPGKVLITFTVNAVKAVDLEFLSYKITDNGKAIFARVKGTYAAGLHIIELPLPQDSSNYDLNISGKLSEALSLILWSRDAGGEWKEVTGDINGQVAATLPKLLITSVLNDKDGKTVIWKVKNPSAVDVTLYWNIEGTGQLGSKTIGAGEEIVLAVSPGGAQKLIASVPGVLGYDIVVLAAQLPSPTPVPTTAPTGATATPTPTTGTGTPSTGTNSGTGTVVGDASTSVPTPSPTPSPTTMPSASPDTGGQTATGQTPGSTSNPVVVSDASNTPPIGISQLPQTGEQAPYAVYGAGGLLALLGAYFLRRKARS